MENMMEKLRGTRTEENLRTAFAGESQARNKYSYYANKAEEDGYNQIAEIFRITAINEEQHAKIWFKLLNDGIGTTAENLKNAAEGEHFEWTEMYADFAKTAEEEGFANIARLFSGVAAIEQSHEQRFLTLERAVREGKVFRSEEETTVWICRNCGHIAVGATAPQICPVCSHPQSYFQRRAGNYLPAGGQGGAAQRGRAVPAKRGGPTNSGAVPPG